MKIIVTTLYKRYDYTKRMLEALNECYGIEDYTVLMFIEPGFPEVEQLARTCGAFKREITINSGRKGCNANIFQALDEGFKRSNFVIIFEDDIVPAKDALKFFEACNAKYGNDKLIMDASTYNRITEPLAAGREHEIFKLDWFTPWGWATWKDRWEELKKVWNWTNPGVSWDDAVCKYLVNNKLREVRPRLARTQNIGAEKGTWEETKHHAAEVSNPIWAGDKVIADGEFNEAEIGEQPIIHRELH